MKLFNYDRLFWTCYTFINKNPGQEVGKDWTAIIHQCALFKKFMHRFCKTGPHKLKQTGPQNCLGQIVCVTRSLTRIRVRGVSYSPVWLPYKSHESRFISHCFKSDTKQCNSFSLSQCWRASLLQYWAAVRVLHVPWISHRTQMGLKGSSYPLRPRAMELPARYPLEPPTTLM